MSCLSISAAVAQQSAAHPQPVTTKHRAAAKPKQPTLAEQVMKLQQQLTDQAQEIEHLKSGLSEKDELLKHAEQSAASAQAAVARVESAAQEQQKTAAANEQAVASLQSAVGGIKTSQATLANSVQENVEKLRKAVENPTTLHYKGVTITPSGFINGESIYRSHATGGGLPTAFSSIPYEHADAYALSEASISARQSRFGITVEGKVPFGVMRGILEGDFLGTGTTSNENQSNSYVYRQRIALAELELNSHWTISAGQGWTLAAENRKGISTAAGNIALPQQIDPNYVAGLVWVRGGNIRVSKSFRNVAVAVSAETPQIMYSAAMAGSTPYTVLGSAGNGGGLLNSAVSSCTATTSIVNYTNQAQIDSAGNTVDIAVPVYKTVSSCTNMANVSFNQAPDMLVKVALDEKFGHFEVFGISRFAHQTVYPGETTNSYLYGGIKDIATGTAVAPALSVAGAYTNRIVFGGGGASARVFLLANKLTVGAKGLYGEGVGRYGDTSLPDLTANAAGAFAPIHNLSGLLSVDVNPTPRLAFYAYYGGDYASRADYGNSSTTSLAAPSALFCITGTSTCTSSPTAADIALGGAWGGHWAAPTAAAVGYGSRMLSNASCDITSNPGYNGSSTGYYAGGSCGASTRDVQELTGGYWYDLYKGERGRLRQGIQYSYAVREGWSGLSGIGAKGIENMIFTSLRYYLP